MRKSIIPVVAAALMLLLVVCIPSYAVAAEETVSKLIGVTNAETKAYVAADISSDHITLPADTPVEVSSTGEFYHCIINGKKYYLQENTLRLTPNDINEVDRFLGPTASFNKATGTLIDTATSIQSGKYDSWSIIQHVKCPNLKYLSWSGLANCANLQSIQLDSANSVYSPNGYNANLTHIAAPNATEIEVYGNVNSIVVGEKFLTETQSLVGFTNSNSTIYVPNALIKEAQTKFAGWGNVSIQGYSYPILNKEIHFNAANKSIPQNCAIDLAQSNIDVSRQSPFFTTLVQRNGDVTIKDWRSYSSYSEIKAAKTVSVAGFDDLRVISNSCMVYLYKVIAESSTVESGIGNATAKDYFTVFEQANGKDFSYTIPYNAIFSYESYNDLYFKVNYKEQIGFIPKACVGPIGSTNTPPSPDPEPSGGDSEGSNNTNNNLDIAATGTTSEDGIRLTIPINGKDTEVLLSLDNFTYDYETPEYVKSIAAYGLRKGPDSSFGTYKRVSKGATLKIVGRDGKWLKVDYNGEIAYILEGMTKDVAQ